MATTTFEAQLKHFAGLYEEDILAVFQESIQDVMRDAQNTKARGGRMPVVTGYLRNSLVSALNGSTSMIGPDAYALVVARMELGDIFESGWLAEYAARIEFGFRGADALGRVYNQKPAYYLRHAAAKWNGHVYRNARRLKQT